MPQQEFGHLATAIDDMIIGSIKKYIIRPSIVIGLLMILQGDTSPETIHHHQSDDITSSS